MIQREGIQPAAVVVDDAVKPRADDRPWQVPARELLAITLGSLAESRIEVAELEHAATLGSQLEAFRTRSAPRDALADLQPAPHADVARELMLGCWWSERMLRSIVRQAPAPRIPVEPPRTPTAGVGGKEPVKPRTGVGGGPRVYRELGVRRGVARPF